MVRSDFDKWREGYDQMTYREHQEFQRWAMKESPMHGDVFDSEWAMVFFKWVYGQIDDGGFIRVLEIGGYDGLLARKVLPWNGAIVRWTNVEMVTVPRVCGELRYEVLVPDCWAWESEEVRRLKYDTVVMSHVIEHMRFEQLGKLIATVANKCRWIYVDAPISSDGRSWKGTAATHILEVGWVRVDNLMMIHGFEPVIEGPSGAGWVKFYRRCT